MTKELRLIFWDQLSEKHSWYSEDQAGTHFYLFITSKEQLSYTRHHLQKLVVLYKAHRLLFEKLCSRGLNCIWIDWKESLVNGLHEIINKILKSTGCEKIVFQDLEEHFIERSLFRSAKKLGIEINSVSSEHFLTDKNVLRNFEDDNHFVSIENFYFSIRKSFSILMEEDGNRIEDSSAGINSNHISALSGYPLPMTEVFRIDARNTKKLIRQTGIEYFGRCPDDLFDYCIERNQAIGLLNYFCENLLKDFGNFNDAMLIRHKFIFHNRLSFALNLKLISPLESVRRVENYFRQNPGEIDINAAENFVRQVIGWREYVRSFYYLKVKTSENNLRQRNYRKIENKLEEFILKRKEHLDESPDELNYN